MRLAHYPINTLKETPAEAEVVSHQLMLRAGLIRRLAAGLYSWLPLGLRVLQKVERIIREEMNRAGALEMVMPVVQPGELWQESRRWSEYGPELLRFKDRHERDFVLGPTHEEVITDIVRRELKSYRQLPVNFYQIQTKFRDEVRPRFGVMRGREFLMKDSYSFDLDQAGARRAYNKMFMAYLRTFARMGLKAIPMAADTGPIGGDLSHEFIILAETGESEVYCHRDLVEFDVLGQAVDYAGDLQPLVDHWTSRYAATDEKHDAARFAAIPEDKRLQARGIEVGHIFYFGTKYSAPMKAVVASPGGEEVPVQMGSYGIGVSRLVGAIIEASHDDAGIIWPDSVAPFAVGLINLKRDDAACTAACDALYDKLEAAGLEVLYDDTEERPGAKFATMDLIGLPWALTLGPRGLKAGTVELKRRAGGAREELSAEAALARLAGRP